MTTLFEKPVKAPLAEQMRPKTLQEVLGQDHLLGSKGALHHHLQKKQVPSLIFWGPPGCGKTTIAQLLAHEIDAEFMQISAIFSGVADLKKIFERAEYLAKAGRHTLLFVDEIHRFNRAQQDAFLPHVERGLVTLVGATTENPSFELNAALLSRCQVMTLKALQEDSLKQLRTRVEGHLGHKTPLTPEAEAQLYQMAQGDGRYFLTLMEALSTWEGAESIDDPMTPEQLASVVQKKATLYDKNKDQHYNLISALHKSVRGSDVDAALYWLARMLQGGEDPLYLARRLIRMATEDIGMADPQALPFVMAATQTYERLGSPEGELALAQAVVYLATAPKSNAAYMAFKKAQVFAKEADSLDPPKHILNAPTDLMKNEGYGAGYVYDPDTKEGFSGQNYFPDQCPRQQFYDPPERGFERDINKRLAYWKKLRENNS